jgi:hypothetical protein
VIPLRIEASGASEEVARWVAQMFPDLVGHRLSQVPDLDPAAARSLALLQVQKWQAVSRDQMPVAASHLRLFRSTAQRHSLPEDLVVELDDLCLGELADLAAVRSSASPRSLALVLKVIGIFYARAVALQAAAPEAGQAGSQPVGRATRLPLGSKA